MLIDILLSNSRSFLWHQIGAYSKLLIMCREMLVKRLSIYPGLHYANSGLALEGTKGLESSYLFGAEADL
jgi:hypothetical protein